MLFEILGRAFSSAFLLLHGQQDGDGSFQNSTISC